MKKIALMILSAMSLIACSNGTQANNTADNDTAAEDNASKTLVVYFSATGTTRAVAERLAAASGADLHEIVPEQPYTSADLDWHDENSRSSVEMKDLTSRPAIKDAKVANLAQYDTVYIGFPIWWYTAPTIINTFVEANDFGKATVIPFATSGGSTIDKSCADLKASYPAIQWGNGHLLNNVSDEELKALVAK